MMNTLDYQVRFGPEAWTLEYADESGAYVVTFDCDVDSLSAPAVAQTLILNPGVLCSDHHPSATGGMVDPGRAALIMQRVRDHLQSLGYVVTVS
jgi:hypothetical protein